MLGIVYVVMIIMIAVAVRVFFKKAWIAQLITGAGLLPALIYCLITHNWLLAVPLLLICVSDLRWAQRNFAMRF
ncbi:MAG TPA: hypothetical protein VJM32_06480 [Candidatus Saccharimonadales bacterium]|nr:hypothetical protein [Candidatus Saccharimonadales bacterium]